ncbi:hypothetical protein E2562_034465 [Oryza meyeriana var. granulata]|uniref:Uncharacterized protein n=1 Tax=Oryza meyeriana var. granulata TaxID=110450 RepID=A0A6G1CWA7_9ORYZ|nr:hypothetical protein E2562_034465 [Oryza meyeriana var. granulata]
MHRNNITEEIAATAAVSADSCAFHEHHEKDKFVCLRHRHAKQPNQIASLLQEQLPRRVQNNTGTVHMLLDVAFVNTRN